MKMTFEQKLDLMTALHQVPIISRDSRLNGMLLFTECSGKSDTLSYTVTKADLIGQDFERYEIIVTNNQFANMPKDITDNGALAEILFYYAYDSKVKKK